MERPNAGFATLSFIAVAAAFVLCAPISVTEGKKSHTRNKKRPLALARSLHYALVAVIEVLLPFSSSLVLSALVDAYFELGGAYGRCPLRCVHMRRADGGCDQSRGLRRAVRRTDGRGRGRGHEAAAPDRKNERNEDFLPRELEAFSRALAPGPGPVGRPRSQRLQHLQHAGGWSGVELRGREGWKGKRRERK